MKDFLSALAVPLSLLSSPVFASEEVEALAECAWHQVPSSALLLTEKQPNRGTIYDDLDNKNAGPFYRVYAACREEKHAFEKAVGSSEVSYQLLRELRRSQPDEIGQDVFKAPVFRCEAQFPDEAAVGGPPLVWWGFGSDLLARQLGERFRLFNNQFAITTTDISAVEQRGDGVENMLSLFSQIENQEVREVESYREGLQTHGAFKIKATVETSDCQLVSPEGELIDA